MLLYKKNNIKIYSTNNLLLILDGEKIVKELFVEDKSIVEDTINEFKESNNYNLNLLAAK